ncbi:MAG: alanine--tRNA ligase [Candidatus Nanopelagicales bacterium]
MESAEIRRRFLAFFEERGHTVVPSASLLLNDPTLLFVNAGMVPFKPYFLGEAVPPYDRATSVQKVVRTLDIEEVGKTTRHASFFQMCGNFSFGDYFKEGAIPMAWDLLTMPVAEGGYGFPEDRLWVTVYEDDDEAARLWQEIVGLPEERIQRRGMTDNFWSMGVPGPCGPCSEIYYDRGPDYGRAGGPIADEERYLEVWNLVFMQFERGEGPGKEGFPILGELPKKSIDTGLGLERMAAILQGVDNIYEIDTTRATIDTAVEITGRPYGRDHSDDVALRVVADHARTCAFLISDGVLPGNEGRGYVLRRLLRRVVFNMRLLGAHEPAMGALIRSVISAMSPQYPSLLKDAGRIETIAVGEEEAFRQTLRSGTSVFDTAVAATKSRGAATLSGSDAFALHDTYGFPIDLTLELAAEQGLEVDRDGFAALMTEQRQRAKADAVARKAGVTPLTAYREVMEAAGRTQFTGYDEWESDGRIKGLLHDGQSVTAAKSGETVEVVLDRSPFYAEAGGQLGDHGLIRLDDGTTLRVDDVQTPVPGLWVHRATVLEGEAAVGASAVGAVDVERRRAISRAHTATHMIHKAFREMLGETATQMGSENAPGRLRFDFPFPKAVPDSVLRDAEARVNALLLEDMTVSARWMTQAQALEMGAMALFGEKYGDTVRVVSVGDWAHELCGGTHAHRSGQLGVVSFISEGSIGSGVRRVEALVGSDAYSYLAREHLLVTALSTMLKSPREDLVDRVGATVEKLKNAEREITRLRHEAMMSNIDSIIGEGRMVGRVRLWTMQAPAGTDAKALREIALTGVRNAPSDAPAAVLAAAVADGRVSMIATVNSAAQDAGLFANELLARALPAVEGRGGGKKDAAQGGGSKADGVPEAFAGAEAFVRGLPG